MDQELLKVIVDPFTPVQYHAGEEGYIVWRRGTGDNVELLNINAYDHRKGAGTRLLRIMLSNLKRDPPKDTVYGFCRVDNVDAREFYLAMGFSLTRVVGVYEEGQAICFSATYKSLLERHNV